jgi:hypothetical protein
MMKAMMMSKTLEGKSCLALLSYTEFKVGILDFHREKI